MVFKEVKSEFVTFLQEGDEFVGKLVSKEKSEDFGVFRYTVIEDGGSIEKSLLGTSVLDRLLEELKEGQRFKIIYLGEKPHKNKAFNPTKLFKVFLDE